MVGRDDDNGNGEVVDEQLPQQLDNIDQRIRDLMERIAERRRIREEEQQAEEAAERVLNRHDCPHEAEDGWIKRTRDEGENTQCEMCYCRKLKWVWECPDCGTRLCRTCRLNRL